MKKLPTELTNEELLKLLDTSPQLEFLEDTIFKFTDKVNAFISKYNIKPGENKVLSKHLYKLFKLQYPEIPLQRFTTRMKIILPSDKSRFDTVFLINKELLEISKSVENLIFNDKTNIKVRKLNKKRHIEGFIKYFKLAPGNTEVDSTILADLYDRWTYKTKKKKVSNAVLSSLLQLYLPHKKLNNKRYFYVNSDIFQVVSKRQLRTILKSATKEKKDN